MTAYSEGIDAECNDKILNSKLYCNRALIQMKLKNFGKCIEDCNSAIQNNENFTKAYYRKAQA